MGSTFSVAVGVAAGVAVIVGDEGTVAVAVTVAVGDSGGQPLSAALTAATSSLTDTMSSPLVLNAGQSLSGDVPSAMLTPLTSSLMLTSPDPSQSPGQTAPALVAASTAPSSANAVAARRKRHIPTSIPVWRD